MNDRILVAWNGSREAAQAIGFAMPLLKKSRVWVLTADTPGPASGNDLIPYLRQHQVEVETMPFDVKAGSTPATILQAAKIVDAGLIVMGAYGHSRTREMILGGVTDFILKTADVPVLLAH